MAKEATVKAKHRDLCDIAAEIDQLWATEKVSANTRAYTLPYRNAMRTLCKITDSYGHDSAREIVLYFLSNCTNWRGENARRIKAELKKILES
jgi:hypothetical protein